MPSPHCRYCCLGRNDEKDLIYGLDLYERLDRVEAETKGDLRNHLSRLKDEVEKQIIDYEI